MTPYEARRKLVNFPIPFSHFFILFYLWARGKSQKNSFRNAKRITEVCENAEQKNRFGIPKL